MTVPFIDVSNHQGVINWTQVGQAGKRGAFIKATQGTYFHDGYFQANWAAAAAQQMWRGAYHYADPTANKSGVDEAKYFCDFVLPLGQLQGDLYVIDLEEGPPGANLSTYLLEWCKTVEAIAKVKPLIYSSTNDLEAWQCTKNNALADYGLWLAAPDATNFPAPPLNWAVTAFWQYSWHGHVPGVQGDCDLDYFNGDETQLAKYGVTGA